ncbi:hydrogenase maturation nickel metallochaperone HypA (plasmid) [Tolypothrix sp. PCC 7910]|uniref:hydrogenase maturation nickel metallochaperone HypA n=1 Tax=Tolypothrix sp. PCC 7910 TaxID=2099387 RepID=UPI0014279952|nr:hydrogenase maturation nickel metallochaperone HypA [Tolypothrix sp. PCC 7910]QIR41745.1 hydrogenase maturation nickel metallochaperone HypA [Tolypothrix sp. PCC 7910]
MPKIKECDRCLFCAHDPYIVCAVHPGGPASDTCLDFREDPELEGKQFVDFLGIGESNEQDQWQPEGASYYNGELIVQPEQRWTQEEQLELIELHPMFTGKCPQCGYEFNRDWSARVHWDCPECGWMDDTV